MNKFSTFLFCCYIFIHTHNSPAQWVQVQNGIGANHNITSLVSGGSYIFAASASGGVYRSSNNGDNWQAVNTGLSNTNVSTLYFNNNNLFAGTFGGGVFLSTNNGDNWSAASGGLTNLYINCFYTFNNKLFIGTSDTLSNSGGVFVTSNNGLNWSFTGLSGLTVRSFTSTINYLLAGTGYNGTTGGLFRTTNSGLNWAISNSGLLGFGIEVNALSSNGANIYAGTGTGIYLSINNGGNWESISIQLSAVKINCLAFYNFFYFTGTSSGIYISTNYGVNWLSKNQGFPPGVWIPTLLTTTNYIYAGTNNKSVWRRDANEIIGIKQISTSIPEKFLLEQNYPNPFNPSTNIKYQITNNKNIVIKIFDVMGRESETLVNEKQTAGYYEVKFDGSNYPSGVYYYQLSIDNVQCSIRKMVLIK